MPKALIAVRHQLHRRSERGAISAEYGMATVAACGLGGILIALLKSGVMTDLFKSLINYALRFAGVEGVQL